MAATVPKSNRSSYAAVDKDDRGDVQGKGADNGTQDDLSVCVESEKLEDRSDAKAEGYPCRWIRNNKRKLIGLFVIVLAVIGVVAGLHYQQKTPTVSDSDNITCTCTLLAFNLSSAGETGLGTRSLQIVKNDTNGSQVVIATLDMLSGKFWLADNMKKSGHQFELSGKKEDTISNSWLKITNLQLKPCENASLVCMVAYEGQHKSTKIWMSEAVFLPEETSTVEKPGIIVSASYPKKQDTNSRC